ncbi:synaptobrevin-domain-containing protein [Linnemannia elongata]|nr:synaptobrevin-domain-containing protein [Linnemannia elongata]
MPTKPNQTGKLSTPYDPPHSGPSNKTAQLQQQVNDVVGIMQQNIDSVRDRGEKLDTLHHKTADLEQGAVQFRRGASGVRRQMWLKNMKWRIAIILGVILLLVIIIVPIVKSSNGK